MVNLGGHGATSSKFSMGRGEERFGAYTLWYLPDFFFSIVTCLHIAPLAFCCMGMIGVQTGRHCPHRKRTIPGHIAKAAYPISRGGLLVETSRGCSTAIHPGVTQRVGGGGPLKRRPESSVPSTALAKRHTHVGRL